MEKKQSAVIDSLTPLTVMERPSWVLPKALAEMTGYTAKALTEKAKKGQLIDGYHFKKSPDGKYIFNWRRYEEWMCENTTK